MKTKCQWDAFGVAIPFNQITISIGAAALAMSLPVLLSAQIDHTAKPSAAVEPSAAIASVPDSVPDASARPATASTDSNADGKSASAGQGPAGNDENSIPGMPSISLSEPSRLTFADRTTLYTHSIFTPEILVGPAFGAGLGQLRNDPPEWREGMAGYGRRFGSGLARNVISRTVVFGVAAADGEDPRYIRSEESGVWRRTRHAVVWTFVTRNQSGNRMPAFSRLVGAYGAAFAANNWYPNSENNANHALRLGSTAIASSVGFHVLSEFWPDIRKFLHFRSNN